MSSVSLFCVLLLGILEGITEWLPVSSTGHLILLDDRLPLIMDPAFGEFFRVAIQLGAILAVLLLSRKELNPLSRDTRASALRLWKHILLGVLPAAAASPGRRSVRCRCKPPAAFRTAPSVLVRLYCRR